MMNFKKLISLFLAVLTLCSVLTSLSVVTVSAEEVATEPSTEAGTGAGEATEIDYQTQIFASPEEKLATMKKMTGKGNFEIYADEVSGEVAVKDLKTGQILFSNPYDIGTSTASEDTKKELLSQIIVKFSENGREREFTSYEHAAMKDQIKVKNIKNGIRVEYTIGREEARRLVPRRIEKERFRTLIQAPLEEYYGVSYEDAQKFKDISGHQLQSPSFYLCKQMSYFQYKDLDECTSDRLKEDLLATFPIVGKDYNGEKMDIYVLDPSATVTEIEKIEEIIKTACPNYSYEEMDFDHQLTEYVSEDENPPVFKMALEYTLDESGFSVRLPANGIRFNESKFQLLNVSVLPYMGAGNRAYEGYTFYPDGSGALFAFEDLVDQNTTAVTSKIYGVDYAYHKITGTYQQTVRYPVFGVVENTRYYDCVTSDEDTGEDTTTTINGVIYDSVAASMKNGNTSTPIFKKYGGMVAEGNVEEYVVNTGYVAIIEEGDALTELVNYHAGVLSPYNTVKMNFSPRPQDSYNVADAISVGTDSEWTVVSERKYVGNYKIRYIMLSDENRATENELKPDTWYEATWLGMAMAYRDYLEGKGVLTPLSADKTSGNIPLYIESFGAMETVEKILSIPVEVMQPLTSTDNVITMYEELSDKGVDNINFKLTGYSNGGMYATAPYKLKWEKSTAEEYTMQDLFDYAVNDVKEGSNLGIFPDFDFSYVMMTGMFDGFSMRNHAVRTIDDRYSYKREWIPTQQKYGGYYQLAVSPAYFSRFYTKLMENYLEYDNITGISVGSLGNALNSDFDEDEPYNREDSKGFVTKALEFISGSQEGMDVMVEGGNAYSWQYADHILGASLDSSRYISASYSVPFVGVVLHGYMNFAGSPLNMEGDVNYAKLKAIENGASIYFTLSYQNTQNLKEDFYLNRYYSIRYDIWKDDVVEIYNELNTELKDVQDKFIMDHEFLVGTRVPDTTELDRDIAAEFNTVLDYQQNQLLYQEQQKSEAVADARDQIAEVEKVAERFVKECIGYYSNISGAAFYFVDGDDNFETRFATYNEAKQIYDDVEARYEAADEAGKKAMEAEMTAASEAKKQAYNRLRTYIRNVSRAIATIEQEYTVLTKLLEDAKSGALLINNTEGCPPSILTEIEEHLRNTEELMAQQMGVRFDYTVDKAEVDLFIRSHISNLLYTTYGAGNVGKAEAIYKILATEEFGLLYTEIDLLRYLEANRNLSDAELIAKYNLNENKSSMEGLVLYVQELLGDQYAFDPVVAAEAKGVENNIREYFNFILYTTVTDLSDKNILPTLNFVQTRLNENDRPIPNRVNISAVTKAMEKEIDAVLTGKDGTLSGVTNGNYDLDTIFSKEQMDTLVAAMVKIVETNTPSKQNPNPKNPVEYATPETLEADIRNYVESYYYRKVINTISPDLKNKVSLQILTVNYTTDTSIQLLVDKFYDATAENPYTAAVDTLKGNVQLTAAIAVMTAKLEAYYGTESGVSETLMDAFVRAYATTVLNGGKKYDLPNASIKPENSDRVYLRKEAEALLAERMPTTTLLNIDALINDVVALHDKYENENKLEADYDKTAASTEYVCYYFLNTLTKGESDRYYYDAEMATMDATVRAEVAEKNAAILAKLNAAYPDGFTVYQLYNEICATLAIPGDSAQDFAAEVASQITHIASGKGSIVKDVQAYYCYLLFSSFDGYELEVPEITFPADKSATIIKNAMKIVDEDLKDRIPALLSTARKNVANRGDMPNYGMNSFLTDAEITAIANELFDGLVSYLFAEESERATMVPELEAYLQYTYYMAVIDRLNATKATEFSVSETYGKPLHEVANDMKSLLYYYVLNMTEFPKESLDDIFVVEDEVEETEEEEEASRYISDDGRLVAVTYGSKNKDGSYTAYKTFVLNYNNFSVSVEYDGTTYTIPAYGYVVVMRNKS